MQMPQPMGPEFHIPKASPFIRGDTTRQAVWLMLPLGPAIDTLATMRR